MQSWNYFKLKYLHSMFELISNLLEGSTEVLSKLNLLFLSSLQQIIPFYEAIHHGDVAQG